MKIGITGAAGNVGSTLQKGLAETAELTLFDQKVFKSSYAQRIVTVDLTRRADVRGLFDGLDALIHLAGNPRPNAPRESTFRNNFMATSFVFDEAQRAGVGKIVFASSNFYHETDIGRALEGSLGEKIALSFAPTPQSLYGESKVYGESLGRHLAYCGMQFVALRIGWTVPEDDPSVYGGDYMRAVFCSKRDLVEAFRRALEVKTDFLAAFAVSNNRRGVFDLSETARTLGFKPQDDAESFF